MIVVRRALCTNGADDVPVTPVVARYVLMIQNPIPNRILFIIREITISSAWNFAFKIPGSSAMTPPQSPAAIMQIAESINAFPVRRVSETAK